MASWPKVHKLQDCLTSAPETIDEIMFLFSRTKFHTSQSGQVHVHVSRQPDIVANPLGNQKNNIRMNIKLSALTAIRDSEFQIVRNEGDRVYYYHIEN